MGGACRATARRDRRGHEPYRPPAGTARAFLAEFLDLTDSAFGFIGEVLRDAEGAPFIRAHAQTNIAWNDATRELYERTLADGMEFHNLGTLFGACLTMGTPVIANEPAADARSGGLPSGHPPLDSFLGLPVFHGDQMVGMVGIANRPGGYDERIVAYLGPLLATTAGITDAYRQRGARRSIAAALQEREGLLRAVIEHAPGAIYVKDAAGRYVVYNPAGARSRGLDPDAVIGRTDLDLFDANEAATFRLEDRGVMQSRETRAYESTITVDGQRRTILNTKSPWLDEGGSLRGIIGITTDITDRVAAAEALEHERELVARSETMLRGIILSAGEAIITSDLKGRILSFNPAAESMFGYESDAIVGQQVEVLMPDRLRSGHEQGMRRRAEGIRGPAAGRWTRRTAQRSDGTTSPSRSSSRRSRGRRTGGRTPDGSSRRTRSSGPSGARRTRGRTRSCGWRSCDSGGEDRGRPLEAALHRHPPRAWVHLQDRALGAPRGGARLRRGCAKVAEGVGFEPTGREALRFSRPLR